MNKNIIFILIFLVAAVGAYFLFMNDNTASQELTIAELQSRDYVGLTTNDAEAKAEAEGTPFRVVEIDGESQPTTRDYREGRINATVEGGVVTSYTVESNDPMVDADTETEVNANDEIIGMTTAEAEAYAEAQGVDFRVGVRDGEDLPVTLDLRPGRITAEVENGVVVGYTVE
jgi:hypothetical protein